MIAGWIFDAYPVPGGICLWVIDREGRKYRLVDPFSPRFYMGGSPALIRRASAALSRLKIRVRARRTERIEFFSGELIPVVEIEVADPMHLSRAAKAVEDLDGLSLYHCDIPPVQTYFYERESFPLAFCEFDADRDGRVTGVRVKDSVWETDYEAPPLAILRLGMDGEPVNPNHARRGRLMATADGETHVIEAESDAELIERLNTILRRSDPDVILTEWGDSYILPRLSAVAEKCRLPLELNREAGRPIARRRDRSYFSYGQVVHKAGAQILHGRWHVDLQNSFIVGETEMEGLFEFARLSKIPVQQMARTSTGTGITSMQMDLAFREGILIPWRKREPEGFKSALELLVSDKGGLIYLPEPGLRENVAEVDFASMYPALMERFNISPETMNCDCCDDNRVPEIGHHICRRRRGLIPKFLKPFLEKRARYKRLMKETRDPERRRRYDQRQAALKWGLVTTFGYQGYKNARFGKIEAHEAITAYSRDRLLQAKEIAEDEGFALVHAIVDSLWIWKANATEHEILELTERILKETGIPIAFEGFYRWVLFVPSRTDPKIGVANRYLGVFRSGEIKIRGLEARRSDTPPIVRKFQLEAIALLAQTEDREGYRRAIPAVLDLLREVADRLKSGRVAFADLVIHKTLSQEPTEYQHANLTAIVAQELAARGVRLMAGESIGYIITDSKNAVRSDRARAYAAIDGSWGYDAEKYLDLLLKSAEALLGTCGYDVGRLRREVEGTPSHRKQ